MCRQFEAPAFRSCSLFGGAIGKMKISLNQRKEKWEILLTSQCEQYHWNNHITS